MNLKNTSIWFVVTIFLVILIVIGLNYTLTMQSQIVSLHNKIKTLHNENVRLKKKLIAPSSGVSTDVVKLKAERENLFRARQEIQKIKNSPTVTPRRK